MHNLILCLFLLIYGYIPLANLDTCLLDSSELKVFKDTIVYTVFQLKGHVKNLSEEEELKPLSKFTSKDNLLFNSKDARLAIIDQKHKSYIANPAEGFPGYTLRPIKAKWNTRPGKILNYQDFVKYLEGKELLILGQTLKLEVGENEFPMDEKHFFYIRYKYEGDTINKKLEYIGNQLIVDKKELYKIEESTINAENIKDYSLYYYNAVQETSLKINDFKLIFPDEELLIQEIKNLKMILSTAKPELIREAIEDYLFDIYGVPEKNNLNDWLEAIN